MHVCDVIKRHLELSICDAIMNIAVSFSLRFA